MSETTEADAAAAAPASSDPLGDLLTTARIIVTAGSGGVGKTTTAAALALEGCRRGQRAVVVTIDPAKRLADALGLAGLTNKPAKIDGDWPGELWALMLDTKSTFDELVVKHSADPDQAGRILANPFYRNISGALSGTQEYMAMEKLYELHQDNAFDLVVVDTPPTRHALDFIDAPRRLTRFLDHRFYRVLMAPSRGLMKAANIAAQAFVRTLAKVVGSAVIDDVITFFGAFAGMEQGFKVRANFVFELLVSPVTAFVLVTAPRRDTVDEADYFAVKLAEAGIDVRALIVNRMHPRFGKGDIGAADLRAAAEGSAIDSLYANLADFRLVADAEEGHLVGLAEKVAPAPVVRVPFLRDDVHDLDGLLEIGRYLFTPVTPGIEP
ncbi:MAG: ArsA family ATPase [Acidimicrobiia bacterium]